MSNILKVTNLCKNYREFSLKDVSFTIPKGYICGFIGPNGAGKTTTIKSILNIIRPDGGSIELFGKTGSDRSLEKVGVVMDAPFYVDDWTVREVEAAVSPFYNSWDAQKYSECLSRFSIDKTKKVKELSRGMKVKLQMSAALSHNAELLVLDEPTSGLDPIARDELCDILREFTEDGRRSVLFSTHITSDLEKNADCITFILGGRIVFTGEKDALMEKYARTAGGIADITAEQKKLIIGYREHSGGFEGMIDIKHIRSLGNSVFTEPASLEEIIVFMSKGVKDYE